MPRKKNQGDQLPPFADEDSPLSLSSPSFETPSGNIPVSALGTAKGPDRVTINMSAPLKHQLAQHAEEQDITLSEAARDSIKRDLYLQSHVDQGWKIVLESPSKDQFYILPTTFKPPLPGA